MSFPLRNQRTISEPVTVEGCGYWSGLHVTVEFRPAPVDAGYVFVRRDVENQPRIEARIARRIDMSRRTALGVAGSSVDMVEHVLAALAGMQIDNCEIWVDRAEMPGCDGSSKSFVDAFATVEVLEQDALRAQLVIQNEIRVGNEQHWIKAEPSATPGFFLNYQLDYERHPVIGQQAIELQVTPDSFVRELSTARTFLLKHEADWLREQGLGRRVTLQDLLVFDAHGLMDNELRFSDECVRHKALDVVGDFALAPFDIVGKITAYRSGHQLNAEMVKVLLLEGRIIRTYKKSA